MQLPGMQQLTIRLPTDLVERLRIFAIIEKRPVQKIVEEALTHVVPAKLRVSGRKR